MSQAAWVVVVVGLVGMTACSSETKKSTEDSGALEAGVDAGADLATDHALPDRGADTSADLLTDRRAAEGPMPLELTAGAASAEITPPIGAPLGGYGGAPRRVFDLVTIPAHLAAIIGNCYDPTPGTIASLFAPSTGKHDPITAKALVLDNGATKAAIVKIDAVGVSRGLRADVEKAAQALGIPKQNLIVAATHTHSGPGAVSNETLWQLIALDCLHQGTYDMVLKGITDALKAADLARKPAAFGVGSTTQKGVSKNRANQPTVDEELGLLKIVDATTQAPIAAVMNFAIHGTCLGASNMEFSADVMGYAERELEKKLGKGVVVFTNGAEGDVTPAQGGFAGAASIGGTLATTSETLWKTIATKRELEIAGSLAFKQMPTPTISGCLPLFGDGKSLCDYLGPIQLPIANWLASDLPFGALRLGNVALATVPGEPVTAIGFSIKNKGKALGYAHTFVVGLANEHMGYIATKAMVQANVEYEAQMTLYGENTGQIVINAAEQHLKAVLPATPPSPGG